MLRVVYLRGEEVSQPKPKKQTYKERIEIGAEYLMQKWRAKDEAEADEKLARLERLGRI